MSCTELFIMAKNFTMLGSTHVYIYNIEKILLQKLSKYKTFDLHKCKISKNVKLF